MAHIVSDTKFAAPKFGFGFIGSIFQSVAKAWAQQSIVRQTMEELDRLSDAELRDIGVVRSEIPRIAFDAAFGEGQDR